VDEATLSALDRNYLDASRLFMACSDTGEYVERHDLAIVCCGVPADDLNMGFLKPPYLGVEAAAKRVADYFGARRLRFRLGHRVRGDDAWSDALPAAGWKRREDRIPGMAREIADAFPAPPDGLAIDEVRSADDLVAYRETAFAGFGYPVAAAHIFLNERMLGLPDLRLYAGRVAGQVVATSMLWVTGDVGGIYTVATLEGHRGRGYGEALTWAACDGARAHGGRLASLQASTMGRPVYARMGFEHVLDYAFFGPPDAADR
jgi:GNAT superfamily N-acetyltransferase